MNFYKLVYKNGDRKIVKAKRSVDVIRAYDLCTKDNIGTKIVELDYKDYKWLESVTGVVETI